MNGFRWLASPLTATVGVLTGLGALSVPLRHLTSARTVEAPTRVVESTPANEMHAVLRLKLLAPAKRLLLRTTSGKKLLDLSNVPAGESEHDAVIRWDDGQVEFELTVEFGSAESAVFLTVLPDGREERTRYLIGSGEVSDILSFDWQNP